MEIYLHAFLGRTHSFPEGQTEGALIAGDVRHVRTGIRMN